MSEIKLSIPIPVYDDVQKQYRFKTVCEGTTQPSDRYHLVYPLGYIPPFQSAMDTEELVYNTFIITTATLINVCNGDEIDVTGIYGNVVAKLYEGRHILYMVYYGSDGHPMTDEGIYYLEFLINGTFWRYTETWKADGFTDTPGDLRAWNRAGGHRLVDISLNDLRKVN